MNALNEMMIGGPVREPSPQFEAWWDIERAWYDSQEAHVSVVPAHAPRTSCAPRARRRRTTRQRKNNSDDDGEPDPEQPATPNPTPLASPESAPMGADARLGLAGRLGQLLAARWLRRR